MAVQGPGAIAGKTGNAVIVNVGVICVDRDPQPVRRTDQLQTTVDAAQVRVRVLPLPAGHAGFQQLREFPVDLEALRDLRQPQPANGQGFPPDRHPGVH